MRTMPASWRSLVAKQHVGVVEKGNCCMNHMIVIGGGPAALAATAYALDKRIDVRLVSDGIGGKVIAPTAMADSVTQASWAAVELFERAVVARRNTILHDRAVDIVRNDNHIHVVTQQHGTLEAHTAIVATGAQPVALDVPGARRWLGYGLGYSPTTHAQHLQGKSVAVIGATARALRGAAEVARNARQLYVILPDGQALSAEAVQDVQRLRQRPNVVVLERYTVRELLGSDHIERLAVTCDDESAFISVDAVFADLGLLPRSEMVRRLVEVDHDGFIVVDEHHATSVPGVWAAGDVSTRFSEQLIVALGDGTRAAVSAYDFLLRSLPA